MRARVAALVACIALVGAACGGAPTTAAGARGHGQAVTVLYAGSLTKLMEPKLGPDFDAATGYRFVGYAGGSVALANQIAGKLRRADVFISASPSVNARLMGLAHGDWVRWYATFATAPLVLGFNRHSRFASALATEPWEDVVTRPGFRLGRTDPALDPKGTLTVQVLESNSPGNPRLAGLAAGTAGVYPEEGLVGRLQAGQLDAGFFYANEAAEAGIPTIPLGGTQLGATYTITVLERAPDDAGALAFLRFLVGQRGVALLRADGIQTRGLELTGSAPAAVRSLAGTG